MHTPLSRPYLQDKYHPPRHSLPTCKAFALSRGTFQPSEAFALLPPSSLPGSFAVSAVRAGSHACPSISTSNLLIVIQTVRPFSLGGSFWTVGLVSYILSPELTILLKHLQDKELGSRE